MKEEERVCALTSPSMAPSAKEWMPRLTRKIINPQFLITDVVHFTHAEIYGVPIFLLAWDFSMNLSTQGNWTAITVLAWSKICLALLENPIAELKAPLSWTTQH